jgi:hypothetical protein
MARLLLLALVSAALVLVASSAKTIENIKYKAWLRGGDTQNVQGKPLNSKGLAFLQAYDAKGNGVYSVVRHTRSAFYALWHLYERSQKASYFVPRVCTTATSTARNASGPAAV